MFEGRQKIRFLVTILRHFYHRQLLPFLRVEAAGMATTIHHNSDDRSLPKNVLYSN